MTQSPANTDLAPARTIGQAPKTSPVEAPPTELAGVLARAAALAVEQGADLDDFMRAAWSAFVDTRPGLREHLEAMRLSAELEELRQNGRIPMA
jgi:hypothetical protein